MRDCPLIWRANPALELIYRFKQQLCYLLLKNSCNQNKCRKLAPRCCARSR